MRRHCIHILCFLGVLTSMKSFTCSASDSLYEKIPAFHAYILGNTEGQVNTTHQSEATFTPASTLKTVTALLAYKVLGEAFSYTTTVSITQKEGQTHDAILTGSGDPTLTSEDLEKLLTPLKGQKLTGVFYVDISAYALPEYSTNIMSYDLGCYDCRPFGAVNVDGNLFNVSIKVQGEKITLSNDFGVTCHSHLTLSDEPSSITTVWRNGELHLYGHMDKKEKKPRLHSVAPALLTPYLEQKIKSVLKKLNISAPVIYTKDTKRLPTDRKVINTHTSRPLHEFLPPAFKISDNFVFDALYLTLIHQGDNKPEDWHEGDPILKSFIKEHFDLDMAQALIVDGSGLSRHNQVSPNQLYALLCKGSHIPDFVSAFPAPGEINSSLANRDLPPHIRAKTGFFMGTVTLCGYGVSQIGKPKQAFVIFTNNAPSPAAPVRKLHEQFLKEHMKSE